MFQLTFEIRFVCSYETIETMGVIRNTYHVTRSIYGHERGNVGRFRECRNDGVRRGDLFDI